MIRFTALLLGALFLNIFAVATIRLRPVIFKVKLYKPMMWNFKLSVLPLIILCGNIAVFLLLLLIGAYNDLQAVLVIAYVLFFAGLMVWLLFIPNSGYLITELNLNHRASDEHEVPMWYDIVSVLSFALSGIANTLLNIVLVQLSFLVALDPQRLTARNYAELFLIGLLIIIPVVIGIYLGRVARFNSWDVLHPRMFFTKLKAGFSADGALKEFGLFVFFNTVFFLIMYVAFGVPFYFM